MPNKDRAVAPWRAICSGFLYTLAWTFLGGTQKPEEKLLNQLKTLRKLNPPPAWTKNFEQKEQFWRYTSMVITQVMSIICGVTTAAFGFVYLGFWPGVIIGVLGYLVNVHVYKQSTYRTAIRVGILGLGVSEGGEPELDKAKWRYFFFGFSLLTGLLTGFIAYHSFKQTIITIFTHFSLGMANPANPALISFLIGVFVFTVLANTALMFMPFADTFDTLMAHWRSEADQNSDQKEKAQHNENEEDQENLQDNEPKSKTCAKDGKYKATFKLALRIVGIILGLFATVSLVGAWIKAGVEFLSDVMPAVPHLVWVVSVNILGLGPTLFTRSIFIIKTFWRVCGRMVDGLCELASRIQRAADDTNSTPSASFILQGVLWIISVGAITVNAVGNALMTGDSNEWGWMLEHLTQSELSTIADEITMQFSAITNALVSWVVGAEGMHNGLISDHTQKEITELLNKADKKAIETNQLPLNQLKTSSRNSEEDESGTTRPNTPSERSEEYKQPLLSPKSSEEEKEPDPAEQGDNEKLFGCIVV